MRTLTAIFAEAERYPQVAICKLVVSLCIFWLSENAACAQDWKSQIGYYELVAEKGASLADGTGIVVAQPEAPSTPGGTYDPMSAIYMPQEEHSQFSGKSFINGSQNATVPTPALGHATSVGQTFYGNSSSIAPGITDITSYDANDYINRILYNGGVMAPLSQGFDVTNHSYIGNLPDTDLGNVDKINLLQRYDFVINRDNTVAVAGANNGSGSTTPDIWPHSYNGITVGRTDGGHSHTATTVYGAGRFKPDIVAPASTTSSATPMVAGAAAVLREAASGTDAEQNEVIKAMLFAGATKNEFSDWDRTTSRPIDEQFGFGELNILNSYHIFEGEQSDGAVGSTLDLVAGTNIDELGWDYGDFDGIVGRTIDYDFEISDGQTLDELSAALVWNLQVTANDADGSSYVPTPTLANLDLELIDLATGLNVDESLSTDYNYEHIYLTDLAAGAYRFQITGDSIPTDFGFAWRVSTVHMPEPSIGVLACLTGFLGGLVRRRYSIR